MKRLWKVTVSRTEETEIMVYAEDEADADAVAETRGAEALDDARRGHQEVEVSRPVEVDRFWPEPPLPLSVKARIEGARTALPKDFETSIPYGDFGDEEDATAREILTRLIAERLEREAREAEEKLQGKLFGAEGGK